MRVVLILRCLDREGRATAHTIRPHTPPSLPDSYGAPHDAPRYNDAPDACGFFAPWGGSWDGDYGRFFAGWYSGELVAHGRRVAGAAAAVFGTPLGVPPPPPPPPAPLASPPGPRALRRDARSTSLLSLDSDPGADPRSPSGDAEPPPSRPPGLHVVLKIAGVHWWYRSPAHAAEMTAG